MAGFYPPDTFAEWNHALEWTPVPYIINDTMLRMYAIENCPEIANGFFLFFFFFNLTFFLLFTYYTVSCILSCRFSSTEPHVGTTAKVPWIQVISNLSFSYAASYKTTKPLF